MAARRGSQVLQGGFSLSGRGGWLLSLVVLAVGVGIIRDALAPPAVVPTDARTPAPRTVMVHGTWVSRTPIPAPSRVQRAPDPQRRGPVVPNPRPTPDPEPTPVRPPSRAHTVRTGDSAWRIAARYLGQGERWPELAKANPGKDLNRLRPGMELIIPAPAGGSPPAPAEHRVRRGESLTTIARQYYPDGEWRRIYQANRDRLQDPDRVPPGVRLRIPAPTGRGRP